MTAAASIAEPHAAPLGGESAPSISSSSAASLPRGGGAIRGIGEQVSVEPFTGSLSLSIPLLTFPEGRFSQMVAPTLSYGSGAGNGAWGIGWSIDIPSVRRSTDQHVPFYDDRDTFILSGADRLVAISNRQMPGWQITTFRPRIENDFALIERWTSSGGGAPCFWRVVSRENVTSLYGLSDDATLCDPDRTQNRFEWRLQLRYDDRGNATIYNYFPDHGSESGTSFANLYPASVKVGIFREAVPDSDIARDWLSAINRLLAGENFECCFELQLDYGEAICSEEAPPNLTVYDANPLPRRWVGPQDGWHSRQDPFSSFRSGFQQRTRRLCRRVLVRHRFAGQYDNIARSFEFHYDETPYVTKLRAITQVSYRQPQTGELPTADDLVAKSFPPLEFHYAEAPDLHHCEVRNACVNGLPNFLDLRQIEWVDMNGDGAPGLLDRTSPGLWQYSRNQMLGKLAAPQPVGVRHLVATADSQPSSVRLMDLTGDGTVEIVDLAAGSAGYTVRIEDDHWSGKHPFESFPNIDINDSNTRVFDVDGDGLADLVITEADTISWFPARGQRGFGPMQRIYWETDDNRAPRLLFNDRNQTVFLADMTGDGLTDLVRIRAGDVCYWPSRGHGRFAAKVVMENAPRFTSPERFDSRRLRIADIDGSGLTDLIYLGDDGVACWRNRAGNAWSKREIIPFVSVHEPSAFSVVDLLGNGTSSLVWTANDPAIPTRALRYVHLAGNHQHRVDDSSKCRPIDIRRVDQKPHLLTRVVNNIGGEVNLYFTSSAHFAAADRDALKPWITKLAFPVHVVSRVERVDHITKRAHVTSYRYHHGYFDGVEREFRGFACVEERDSVAFDELTELLKHDVSPSSLASQFYVPPVVKKTWFHTGACLSSHSQFQRLQTEYFQGDSGAMLLPDATFDGLLCGDEYREACRALKGKVLREEIYSEEGPTCAHSDLSAIPYSVSEKSYRVRCLVPKSLGDHGVFLTYADQQLVCHYERQLADPRVTHDFTLEVNDWGNPTRTASIAYGRRASGVASDAQFLSAQEAFIQRRTRVTITNRDYTISIDKPLIGRRHAPLLCEEHSWELYGFKPCGANGFFLGSELLVAFADQSVADFAHDQEELANERLKYGQRSRRLIESSRTHYVDPTGRRSLPLGELDCPALPHMSFALAFDRLPTVLDVQLKEVGRDIDTLMKSAGYVQLPGAHAMNWWALKPFRNYAGHATDAAATELASFVPIEEVDAFNNVTHFAYDRWRLLKTETRQPLGNTTTFHNDYRCLQAHTLVDPNGSVTRLRFDTLGLVVATAIEGRNKDSGDGLQADQSYELSDQQLIDFFRHPDPDAHKLLGQATIRVIYDTQAYYRISKSQDTNSDMAVPIWSCALSRERHVTQLGGATSPIEIAFVYTDGFSTEGQAARWTGNAAGNEWLLTGRRELNNKGNPVREYEPFFSNSHRFALFEQGVSRTTFYDPLQRVVGVLHPDHSWEKTRFGPWNQEIWDRNDTALLDPNHDVDVGGFFRQLDRSDFFPTWIQSHQGGAASENVVVARSRRRTHEKVGRHAGTPHRQFLDSLGNVFLKIADNRTTPPDAANPDATDPPTPLNASLLHTRTEYDVEKNPLRVIDALGRAVIRWEYDLNGSRWLIEQSDWQSGKIGSRAGQQVQLLAADGMLAYRWDEKQCFVEHRYDVLRRPSQTIVHGSVAEHFSYGESFADGASHYARGRLVEEYVANNGGAGAVRTTISKYDWNGQPVARTRVADGESITICSASDAQGRVFFQQHAGAVQEHRHYNLLGQLTRIAVCSSSASSTHFPLRETEYNPRGQCVRLVQNEALALTTHYEYDPSTYRLIRSRTDSGRQNWQRFEYEYDPVGNVVHVHDRSDDRRFLKDDYALKGHQDFEYDSVYRLITASGREHPGQTLKSGQPTRDIDWLPQLQPDDAQQLAEYRQCYTYDSVGNLIRQKHVAANSQNSWTKTFEFETGRNHLQRAFLGEPPSTLIDQLQYDLHGNVERMAHLQRMDWDHENRLMRAVPNVGADARFAYDAQGNRAVKHEQGMNRLYFGSTEKAAGVVTIAIMSGHGRRLATVRTGSNGLWVDYVVSDHLGSARLEVSQSGSDLVCESFEEYYAYGQTSFGWSRHPKRYRWIGKERDAVTGFYYFGARYFVPWQGNWLSADPSGVKDSVNRYQYAHSNPVTNVDADGREASHFQENAGAFALGAGKAVAVAAVGAVAVGAVAVGGAALLAAAGVSAAAIATTGTVLAGAAGLYGAVVTGQTALEVATGISVGTGESISTAERYERAGELAVAAIPALAAMTKSGRAIMAGAARMSGTMFESAISAGTRFRGQSEFREGLRAAFRPMRSGGTANQVQFEKLKALYAAEEISNARRVGKAMKEDIFHRAAIFVSREQMAQGKVFTFRDNQGYKTLLQTPGSGNGERGIFEYIVNSAGDVEHQMFHRGAAITGIPAFKPSKIPR